MCELHQEGLHVSTLRQWMRNQEADKEVPRRKHASVELCGVHKEGQLSTMRKRMRKGKAARAKVLPCSKYAALDLCGLRDQKQSHHMQDLHAAVFRR